MKRTILLAAATLVLALIISTTTAAFAGPFMGGKSGHEIGGMQALMQLDLSQDQKQSIYDILQKYQDEQQATRLGNRGHRQAPAAGPH